MLKVPEHGRPAGAERPLGELVHQLIEDGKSYARAEVALVKAIASAKAGALAVPLALIAAALFIGMAAINALVLGVVLALAKFIGPLLGGLIGMILFFAVAGGLASFAVQRMRRVL